MKSGTWNVRSLYRVGSIKAAARKLARYKLEVVGVQEISWDKEGKGIIIFLRERKQESSAGIRFFCAP